MPLTLKRMGWLTDEETGERQFIVEMKADSADAVPYISMADFMHYAPMKIVRAEDMDQTRALLARAHAAMSLREPDGISATDWDKIIADIAAELGKTNA